MKESIIKTRLYQFAVKTVGVFRYLKKVQHEYVLSKQLLRSGTSIGANVREAQNAESKMDFVHKLGIAQKECDETMYWLELLHETDFLPDDMFQPVHAECKEILRMIRSAIITAKANRTSPNS
ncbi:hypothetical protein SDC9_57528 [bioreactor metagenome]|uniref:Four helix bundle protein n=1 Tax=bioreactor metagenome TaxID=1076179 RepID=A0A644X563_9ZZZZ